MATVSQSGVYNLQSLTSVGALGVGMRLYTYTAGTTTHKTAYTDSAGAVAHTYTADSGGGQYIAMDARGELPAPLYLTSGAYDLALKTAAGATVWTRQADPVGADLAAPGGAASIGFAYAGGDATTLQALARSNFINAAAWGVPTDGTDGTTEMAALMAAHLNIYMPPGNYLFSSSLTLRNGHTIVGAGRLQTIITSGVIGDSLFKVTGAYTGFMYMGDMQLLGNGLTGASGNGHALNLIDPAISSGSFTPAQSTFERLYIRGFKGLDVRDNSATAVLACAIIFVDTLGIEIRNPSIENCGHGLFTHLSQNCRVYDPLITGCTGWGIHSYNTKNFIVYDGDINTCGTDGTTNTTGYLEAGMGTGNVLSARDEGFMMIGTKVKGAPGTAQIHSFISSSDISDCWIRADHSIDKEYIGVLVTNPLDVTVDDNDFSPASGAAYSATRKITNVKVTVLTTHNIAKVRVNDNQFRTQGGALVRANVHFQGASGTTRMEGLEVQGNSFGMPLAVSSAVTIDTDVLFDTGTFSNCLIRGNNHYDATNVTKTAHYELTGGTYLSNDFERNSGTDQDTGQIALVCSGFTPGLESISAAKTFAFGDANSTFLHPSADTTARTWQIPANATVPYPIGTKFTIINQDSAGALTLAVVTDTLRLAGAGTTGNRSLAANGRAVLEKLTATEWIISGTGIT